MGCFNVTGSLNVTLADDLTLPPSIYVINSSCVQGNFSAVHTNYKLACKGKSVNAVQQTTVGHGLDILLMQKGTCHNTFPWWIVGLVVAAAIAIAIILIVLVLLLLRKRLGLLHQADDENINFRLMTENPSAMLPPPPSLSASVQTLHRASNAPTPSTTMARDSPTLLATQEAMKKGLTLPYNKALPTLPVYSTGHTDRQSLLATDPRYSAPPQWVTSPQAALIEPGPLLDRCM
jgi:hypothetical protein